MQPGEAFIRCPICVERHKARSCHGIPDHQVALLGGFGNLRSGVPLGHIDQFDGIAGHLPVLYLFCQRGNLLATVLIGRRDGQRQQVTGSTSKARF